VERHGRLPPARACEYIRQAALGLQHAFEMKMVHRDIKPQNLILTTQGEIKILDFGLARLASEAMPEEGRVGDGAAGELTGPGRLTSPGTLLGTADYMAPEQARGPHAANIRSDIYSLGCTLYYLLTGRVPFSGGSVSHVLQEHESAKPQPL